MTPARKPDLTKLREIGWAQWDPIGLKNSDCPRDEYDRYLLQAAAKLSGGQPVENVAKYLEEIASGHMGLGPSSPASIAACERTAEAIAAYLASLESPRFPA